MTADADDVGFESRLLAFERAWRRGQTPAIGDFLPNGDDTRHRVLIELVCLDLEYRWRNAARHGARPFSLEDYGREFPELGTPQAMPADLVAEEYRVRHRWGDRPRYAEYRNRFGARTDVAELLRRVDEELAEETCETGRTPPVPKASIAYGDLLLRRMIGAGGFGKVYVAERRGVESPVAVKFLRKTFWRRPEAVDRFLAEAATVSRLSHDGIVAVHGAGLTPAGGPFIVMDLVDGPDLGAVIRSGPVAVANVLRWTAQACRAVAHAHEQGVVHCDLNPANLLLGRDGRIRVTDFGLARSAGAGQGIGGTTGFMAPEQLDPRLGPIGPATDVYGLGAVLYAMLTGTTPKPSADATRDALAARETEFDEVVRRCLNVLPGDRYPDARGVLDALGAV